MWDIPPGWQAIFGLVFAAFAGATTWLFNTRRTDRLAASAQKDGEIAALRAKIDKLQDEKLEMVRQQLELAQKRRETDERVARSFEELSNLLRARLGSGATTP
jgi:hypothetical protein